MPVNHRSNSMWCPRSWNWRSLLSMVTEMQIRRCRRRLDTYLVAALFLQIGFDQNLSAPRRMRSRIPAMTWPAFPRFSLQSALN